MRHWDCALRLLFLAAAAAGAGGDSAAAPAGTHFVVAVDGSPGARRAFDTAAALVMPRRGDRITVVHIGDPGKDYLPHEARPAAIETAYSTLCVTRFPTGTSRVMLHDKRASQSTKEAMMDVVTSVRRCRLARLDAVAVPRTLARPCNPTQKALGADLLFVGFTGRKGPKADPTVLGSSADYSLRCVAHVPPSYQLAHAVRHSRLAATATTAGVRM